jgi:hypothetical protein
MQIADAQAVIVKVFGWIALNSLYAAENREKTKTME